MFYFSLVNLTLKNLIVCRCIFDVVSQYLIESCALQFRIAAVNAFVHYLAVFFSIFFGSYDRYRLMNETSSFDNELISPAEIM